MILITKTFKHFETALKKTSSKQLIIHVKGAQKSECLIKQSSPSIFVILNSAKLVSDQSGSMVVILFFMMLLASCNQVERNGQSNSESKVSKCFSAVFDRDTAYVSLEFLGKNIEGKMRIKYGV